MKLHYKILAAALVLIGSSGALSADDGFTVIPDGQGENQGFKYSEVEKITFGDGKMNVIQPGGATSFDLTDISSIRFDLEISSREEIKNTLGKDITITGRDGVYHITSGNDPKIAISVYNLEGHTVATATGYGECDLNLRDKPAGIYIIKINDKIVKLRKL